MESPTPASIPTRPEGSGPTNDGQPQGSGPSRPPEPAGDFDPTGGPSTVSRMSEALPESDDSVTVVRGSRKRSGDSSVVHASGTSTEPEDLSTTQQHGGDGDDDSEVTIVSRKPPHSVPGQSGSTKQLGELLIGKQLGTFKLEKFLGSGGMGAVFQATDVQLHRQVAVKVLKNSDGDPDAIRRFRTEAQSAARLDHENIARVYHVGQDQGWNYIVLELVEGRTLRQLVVESGPLSFSLALNYFTQLAAALQHAHHRKIIHRDIKPSNVLITPEQKIKIVDMGLARIITTERQADETEDGMTLGTFDYIAPEQARDPRLADEQSDLYSLGCTLFYALTGRAPFAGGNAIEKILNHSTAARPNVCDIRPDLPAEANLLVTRLMAANKLDRIQTADELRQALSYLQQPRIRQQPQQPVSTITPRLPMLMMISAAVVFFISLLMDGPNVDSEVNFPDIPGLPAVNNTETGTVPPDNANVELGNLANNDVVVPEAMEDTVGSAGITNPTATPQFELPVSKTLGRPQPISDALPGLGNDQDGNGSLASRYLGASESATDSSLFMAPLLNSPSKILENTNAGIGMVGEERTSVVNERSELMVPPVPGANRVTTIQVRPVPDQAKPGEGVRPNTIVVSTLQDAISQLATYNNVHTIQLCFDRIEDAEPIVIPAGKLRTIIAGDGFRPALRFISDNNRSAAIKVPGGELTLNGIDVILDARNTDSETCFLSFPKLVELSVLDCSWTILTSKSSRFQHYWVRANDTPVSVTASQVQGRVTLLDSAIRGAAELVYVRNFSPMIIRLNNVWAATSTSIFRFDGLLADSAACAIELDISQSSLMGGQGLAICSASADRSHGQLFITAKRSLLASLSNAALVRHQGLVHWEKTIPLDFEGDQNRFSASRIWEITEGGTTPQRSYTLKQSIDQIWFRQEKYINWENKLLDRNEDPFEVEPGPELPDWISVSNALADPESTTNAVGAEADLLPEFRSVRTTAANAAEATVDTP